MKKFRSYSVSAILLLVALAFHPSAVAQSGEALLSNWMASQRDAVRTVSTVRVDEKIVLSIDGGFGKQTLQMDAIRTVGPGSDPPGRAVHRALMNGQEIPFERGERFRRQQRGLLMPEIARLVENFRFPIQDFARMRITRTISQENVNGEQMWRVDATPRNQPDPVERMTAWFDVVEFQLRETQAVLRGKGPATLQILTSYRRIDGIDMPEHIHVEGSSRVRRRTRFFTTLFEVDTSYSDYTLRVNDQ